jgi:hypothetical protein
MVVTQAAVTQTVVPSKAGTCIHIPGILVDVDEETLITVAHRVLWALVMASEAAVLHNPLISHHLTVIAPAELSPDDNRHRTSLL